MGRFLAAGRGTAGHLKEGECLSKDLRKEMGWSPKTVGWDAPNIKQLVPFRFQATPRGK